jgi:hypothetical protein
MHSGGGQKEKEWAQIYIEAPKSEAVVIFYNRFGHNPKRVSCTCCGSDYSIHESKTLKQVSAFQRGCKTKKDRSGYLEKPDTRDNICGKYRTIEQYSKEPDVLIIYAKDIKPSDRKGEVPEQGFVWKD